MTRLRRIEECDRIFFITFNIARGVVPLSSEERELILIVLQDLRGARPRSPAYSSDRGFTNSDYARPKITNGICIV